MHLFQLKAGEYVNGVYMLFVLEGRTHSPKTVSTIDSHPPSIFLVPNLILPWLNSSSDSENT